MYNYPFKMMEENVLNERENVLMNMNDKKYVVNILLTSKNILVFYNKDINNNLGKHKVPTYEILLKIELGKMDYKFNLGNTIFNILNNEVIFYDFDIEEFIRN